MISIARQQYLPHLAEEPVNRVQVSVLFPTPLMIMLLVLWKNVLHKCKLFCRPYGNLVVISLPAYCELVVKSTSAYGNFVVISYTAFCVFVVKSTSAYGNFVVMSFILTSTLMVIL